MCLNYIRAEQMLRTVSLYIAVNEIQFKMTHIDCECTHAFCSTYTYPTWMLLLLLCDKKYFDLRWEKPLSSYRLDTF